MTVKNIKDYLKALKLMTSQNPLQSRYYDFILKHGKGFTKKELTKKEKKYVDSISRVTVRPKQCYYVSQLLAIDSRDKLKYFEGWVIDKKIGFPLEHSWNVIDDKVVDLVGDKVKMESPVYFGVEVPYDFIAKRMLETEMASPVLVYYYDLLESKKLKFKQKLHKEIL